MDSAHLACQSTSMLRLERRHGGRGGWSQIINQAQDVGEQAFRDRDLGELECDVPAMATSFGPDLD